MNARKAKMTKSMMAFTLAAVVGLLVGCNKSDAPNKNLGSDVVPSTTASIAIQPEAPPLKTYEGPLGLAMGVPVDVMVGQLKFTPSNADNPNIYSGTPPKPAPGFDSYFVLATKEQGVCRIGAIAPVDVVNGSGDQIKSETDRIAEMVEMKYGKPTKKYDLALEDVYQRNPEFFMLGLKEDSVTYSYSWVQHPGTATFPNDLAEIEVTAMAVELNKGWVRLLYTFTNDKACNVEVKKQKSSNL